MNNAYQLMGDAAEVIYQLMLPLFDDCSDLGLLGNPIERLVTHGELLAEWNRIVEVCLVDERMAQMGWDCREPLIFDLPT